MNNELLSIVIPVYNEELSIKLLYEKLCQLRDPRFEVIFVNDGSSDKSVQIIREIAKSETRIKLVNLRRNYGQTAAMAAGFDYAKGSIVIPLDADLQNDPQDIPKLLAKLNEGYDVVSGWRRNRWRSKWLTRRIPSAVANWLISKTTGIKLHDYGCTLKAYRSEILRNVKLYGEMHRFIPAFAAWQGARIGEVVVTDREREFGSTKYGFGRTFRVLYDLIAVNFLIGYSTKPMHFFGKIASASFCVSVISFLMAVYFKFVLRIDFILTPLPLLTALFLILGVQFLLMGLIAEMMTRNYYENSGIKIYSVKDTTNL